MKHEKVMFISRYEIDAAMCQAINRLAGQYFNNKAIAIEMGAVCRTGQQQAFILLSLKHFGIEAELYVSLGEAGRLLGLELKHIEPDYLSYIIAKVLIQYGVEFKSCIEINEQTQPLLLTCQLIMGELKIAALLKIDTLVIEPDYLQVNFISLPKKLSLNTCSTIFETKLSVDEIRSLSIDELVLVYPK